LVSEGLFHNVVFLTKLSLGKRGKITEIPKMKMKIKERAQLCQDYNWSQTTGDVSWSYV
jgi:hypothetical protein